MPKRNGGASRSTLGPHQLSPRLRLGSARQGRGRAIARRTEAVRRAIHKVQKAMKLRNDSADGTDPVQRFSEVLVRLHAAPDEASLAEAIAEAVTDLCADAEQRVAWRRRLAGLGNAVRQGATDRAPLVLDLLVAHVEQCRARFRGESTPGRNPLAAGAPPLSALTPREREVLAHVALGETDAAIGVALGISTKTVSKHIEHILEKLGVETRTGAARMALRLDAGDAAG